MVHSCMYPHPASYEIGATDGGPPNYRSIDGLEGAMNDPTAFVLKISRGYITKDAARAIRDLLSSPRHTKPWDLMFDSCRPKDDEVRDLMAEAMSANINSLELTQDGGENAEMMECLYLSRPKGGSIDSIKFLKVRTDDSHALLAQSWARHVKVREWTFLFWFEFFVSGIVDNIGVAAFLSSVYRDSINAPEALSIHSSDICKVGDLSLLRRWKDNLKKLSIRHTMMMLTGYGSKSALISLSSLPFIESLSIDAFGGLLTQDGLVGLAQKRTCLMKYLSVGRLSLEQENLDTLVSAISSIESLEFLSLEITAILDSACDCLLDFVKKSCALKDIRFLENLSRGHPRLASKLKEIMYTSNISIEYLFASYDDSDFNDYVAPLAIFNAAGRRLLRIQDTFSLGLWPRVFERINWDNFHHYWKVNMGSTKLGMLRADAMYRMIRGCDTLFGWNSGKRKPKTG